MTDSVPFMPFYVSDYLADTIHLSCEEHGAYCMLLFVMWKRGGLLPNEDAALSRIARLSMKKWKEIRPNIIPFFTLEGDNLTQKRVVIEYQKSKSIISERSKAGKASARAKSLKINKPPSTHVEVLLQHDANKATTIQIKKEELNTSVFNTAREDEVQKPEAEFIKLGRRLTDYMGLTNDPRWTGNWAIVQVWLSQGYDPELDVWATVTGIVDRFRAKGRKIPDTLKYFSNAIADAHQQRCAGRKVADDTRSTGTEFKIVKKGTPAFNAWVRHWKKLGRSTKFVSEQDFITVPTEYPISPQDAPELARTEKGTQTPLDPNSLKLDQRGGNGA